MIKNDDILIKRLTELANKAYSKCIYTYSDFLSIAELSTFHSISRELSFVPYSVIGGYEKFERGIIRFGDEEITGYTEDVPIACIKIEPICMKFADSLNHRDFLGSLMGLGIQRKLIGDILINENIGYAFVKETISNYICDNLDKVKHTTIKCSITNEIPETEIEVDHRSIQVSSLRADVIIATIYKFSRNDCNKLFSAEKVYVNGRLLTNNSYMLKANDKVTVRGYGRFEYIEITGKTKKGNLIITIKA